MHGSQATEVLVLPAVIFKFQRRQFPVGAFKSLLFFAILRVLAFRFVSEVRVSLT